MPQSYIDLQQAVIQEAERRRTTGEPPILLEEEILQLAKSSPQNDILDTEELTLGRLSQVSKKGTVIKMHFMVEAFGLVPERPIRPYAQLYLPPYILFRLLLTCLVIT